MGILRNGIMEKCPDEFKDELKDFIDTIEDIANSAKNKLDISSISDLGDIDDAFDIICTLADDLY